MKIELSEVKKIIQHHKKEHTELGKIILPIIEKYNLPDKEILEVCQIGKFVYKINSEIKILEKPKPPDPDFIIEYQSKTIGLEHTRIFTEDVINYNKVNSLIKYSEKLFANKFPDEKIFAQISIIDDKLDYKETEKRNLANEIVTYIYNLAKGIDEIKPPFISKVKLTIHSQISFSYNEKNWQGPFLTQARLEREIRKKERKIKNYKSGNTNISEYWLVLFIGSLSSISYQFDENENYETNTEFDKVFLMTDFDAEITMINK
ncbi:hypothetical protein SAMN05660845_1822 [Flavobacterium swingsii]|uniref:Uncharacterized protein n=1 Tax=Flavobacterium swingsii TaxID=498292 RepID=A0A1I0YKF3_9FLAO|nr:hypothetical protein [Flavobacterium swingsii]SFB13814.1 hypothetical protein SAMN05660845_1822 [Flavobacterium swingsii]